MRKSANANYGYPREVERLCAEIVVTVSDISKSSLTRRINIEAAHESICKKFDSVIKFCRVGSLPNGAAHDLLYPLAALADETALSIPQHRFFWSERPLQLRYFGEIVAGTRFFTRLEALMKAGDTHPYVLEMYFTGLAMGLKGMHSAHDPRRRVQIFENLGIKLSKMRRPSQRTLFWGGYSRRPPVVWEISEYVVYPAIVLLAAATAAVAYIITRAGFLGFLDGRIIN